MTKALRFYSEEERKRIAEKRVSGSSRGLGYWAAKDLLNRGKKEVKKVEIKEEKWKQMVMEIRKKNQIKEFYS